MKWNIKTMPLISLYPDGCWAIQMIKKKCAQNASRLQKGGSIAIGNGYYELTDEEIIQQGGLIEEKITDLNFIKELFGASEIIFSYDGSLERVNGAPLILIFRN